MLEREVLATAPGARDSLGGEPGMVGEVLATAPAARDDAHLRGELAWGGGVGVDGGGVGADGGGGSTSRGRVFGVTEAGRTRVIFNGRVVHRSKRADLTREALKAMSCVLRGY